jgi:hypothetical protein
LIDPQAILGGHLQATARRVAAVALALAVPGTTEVDYSAHPATTGPFYREAGQLGKRHRRRQRLIEQKESGKWLKSLEAAAIQAHCPATRIVNVGDREAAVFALFLLSQGGGRTAGCGRRGIAASRIRSGPCGGAWRPSRRPDNWSGGCPPPQGGAAIAWLLLTTVAVTDFSTACERIEWYAWRWMIELYHKILKSACRIEKRQFAAADHIERYLAIDTI